MLFDIAEFAIKLQEFDTLGRNELACSLNLIFEKLIESGILRNDEVEKLSSLVYQDSSLLGFSFFGTTMMRSIVGFARMKDLDTLENELISEYYKKQENNLLLFDGLSRYLMKSSISTGACYLDLQYEVWF